MSSMLKLWLLTSRFHRLIRRSSADKKVSWSVLTETELMWYVCALPKVRLHLEVMTDSQLAMVGMRRAWLRRAAGGGVEPVAGRPGLKGLPPAGDLHSKTGGH